MTAEKNKGSVIVLCLSDPASNPRPMRAIELCLSEGYNVSAMGLYKKDIKGLHCFYPIKNPDMSLFGRLLRKLLGLLILLIPIPKLQDFIESYRYGYQDIQKKINLKKYDLIIVEDLQLLNLAFKIRGKGKVLFDAREYYPLQKEDNIWFKLIEKPRRIQVCRKYLPLCDAILTVSKGLRDKYYKEFDVLADVYLSTPYYHNMPLKAAKPEVIRMIHHGLAHKSRGLEKMVDLFSMLDERFYLDFMLVGNEKYQQELKNRAFKYKNIGFLNSVPYTDIIPLLNSYDLGLFYCEPKTFNLKHSLPNKFFDFIQARLMIAIGPSPDMAELVNSYQCGIVSDEFKVEALANALKSLTAGSINQFKKNSDRAAKELCFENESKKMLQIIDSLLS